MPSHKFKTRLKVRRRRRLASTLALVEDVGDLLRVHAVIAPRSLAQPRPSPSAATAPAPAPAAACANEPPTSTSRLLAARAKESAESVGENGQEGESKGESKGGNERGLIVLVLRPDGSWGVGDLRGNTEGSPGLATGDFRLSEPWVAPSLAQSSPTLRSACAHSNANKTAAISFCSSAVAAIAARSEGLSTPSGSSVLADKPPCEKGGSRNTLECQVPCDSTHFHFSQSSGNVMGKSENKAQIIHNFQEVSNKNEIPEVIMQSQEKPLEREITHNTNEFGGGIEDNLVLQLSTEDSSKINDSSSNGVHHIKVSHQQTLSVCSSEHSGTMNPNSEQIPHAPEKQIECFSSPAEVSIHQTTGNDTVQCQQTMKDNKDNVHGRFMQDSQYVIDVYQVAQISQCTEETNVEKLSVIEKQTVHQHPEIEPPNIEFPSANAMLDSENRGLENEETNKQSDEEQCSIADEHSTEEVGENIVELPRGASKIFFFPVPSRPLQLSEAMANDHQLVMTLLNEKPSQVPKSCRRRTTQETSVADSRYSQHLSPYRYTSWNAENPPWDRWYDYSDSTAKPQLLRKNLAPKKNRVKKRPQEDVQRVKKGRQKPFETPLANKRRNEQRQGAQNSPKSTPFQSNRVAPPRRRLEDCAAPTLRGKAQGTFPRMASVPKRCPPAPAPRAQNPKQRGLSDVTRVSKFLTRSIHNLQQTTANVLRRASPNSALSAHTADQIGSCKRERLFQTTARAQNMLTCVAPNVQLSKPRVRETNALNNAAVCLRRVSQKAFLNTQNIQQHVRSNLQATSKTAVESTQTEQQLDNCWLSQNNPRTGINVIQKLPSKRSLSSTTVSVSDISNASGKKQSPSVKISHSSIQNTLSCKHFDQSEIPNPWKALRPPATDEKPLPVAIEADNSHTVCPNESLLQTIEWNGKGMEVTNMQITSLQLSKKCSESNRIPGGSDSEKTSQNVITETVHHVETLFDQRHSQTVSLVKKFDSSDTPLSLKPGIDQESTSSRIAPSPLLSSSPNKLYPSKLEVTAKGSEHETQCGQDTVKKNSSVIVVWRPLNMSNVMYPTDSGSIPNSSFIRPPSPRKPKTFLQRLRNAFKHRFSCCRSP